MMQTASPVTLSAAEMTSTAHNTAKKAPVRLKNNAERPKPKTATGVRVRSST